MIWVNEHIDPSGIIYSAIACCDRTAAEDCHATFQEALTDEQKEAGLGARLRSVEPWEEAPISALKLS